MRTNVVFTTDPSEWLARLLRQLEPWIAGAGILIGGAASSAAYTFEVPGSSRYVASTIVTGGCVSSPDQRLTNEERLVLYRSALTEATLAQAVLRELSGLLELSEVSSYVNAVAQVLDVTTDVLSVDQAQQFTFGLHAARSQLLEATESVKLWLKVAHVLAPTQESHRVPERFVKRAVVEPPEPLVFNKTSIAARALVRDFLGEHADSAAG